MLTYEYLYRAIDNSRWMMDQRTLSFSKGKCIEMLIPIVSGAIAGNGGISIFSFPRHSMQRYLISWFDYLFVRSGVLSWILVIPFDVIKTIMQAELDPTKHRQMGVLFRTKTHVSQSAQPITTRHFSFIKRRKN